MTNGMLYLIRGLPGSGKSTLANELNGLVCEADQFFSLNFELEYKFDSSQLSKAHQYCQDKVKNAMQDGYTSIIVSNTFTRRWEMDIYYQLALDFEYQVTEITLTGPLHENIHNVPKETIEKMRDRWEK